jgi:D-alanyl-lipoteichoic acid acyltransferase DltB (MBOAT superfamily)
MPLPAVVLTSIPLSLLTLVIPFLFYPVAAYIALKWMPDRLRTISFALVNLAFALGVCLSRGTGGVRLHYLKQYVLFTTIMFVVYVLLTAVQFLLLKKRLGTWFPLVFPLLLLAYIKYTPAGWNQGFVLSVFSSKPLSEFFIGISYMAFRLTYMVHEIRNAEAPMPTFAEYLSFAFFVPTLAIGPINPYSMFYKSYHQPDREITPVGRSWSRIAVGLCKYLFLGNLANQLTYDGLLADGWPHPYIDFPIAVAAYCIYLYCNFSGFCDIAIGVSGLLGINVHENFDRPFRARNLQELWSYWHMTLTNYMRDMLFTPLSKMLIRYFGPKWASHCIAVSIAVVFILLGIWHGAGWNYVIFGVWNAAGVVAVHYYTQFLKKRLGKVGFNKYRENRVIYHIANIVTLAYFSVGLFLVANSMRGIIMILHTFKPM